MWWMYGSFEHRVPTLAPPARHVATGSAAVDLVSWALVILGSVAALAMLVSLADWRPTWLLVWLLLVFVLSIAGLVAIGAGANRSSAAAQAHARTRGAVRLADRAGRAATHAATAARVPPPATSAGVRDRDRALAAVPARAPHAARSRPALAVSLRAPEANSPRTTAGQRSAAAGGVGAAGVQYRDQILRHLIEHYLTGDRLAYGTPNRVTVAEFHRMFRYVVQEGYGE